MTTAPLPLDQPDHVRRLHDMLVSVGFTAEKIGDALGSGDEIVSEDDREEGEEALAATDARALPSRPATLALTLELVGD